MDEVDIDIILKSFKPISFEIQKPIKKEKRYKKVSKSRIKRKSQDIINHLI